MFLSNIVSYGQIMTEQTSSRQYPLHHWKLITSFFSLLYLVIIHITVLYHSLLHNLMPQQWEGKWGTEPSVCNVAEISLKELSSTHIFVCNCKWSESQADTAAFAAAVLEILNDREELQMRYRENCCMGFLIDNTHSIYTSKFEYRK